MKPLISVIVAVYNVEKYLSRCIESVLKQTYSNLEIILVDDGSKDFCGKICDDYALKDSRIKVIHKENGGISSARNAGLKVYRGEYLMFVDSDDFLSTDAIEILYKRITTDKSDMAIGKHTDIYEDFSTNGDFCSWFSDSVISKEDIFLKMADSRYYPVSACTKLYKSKVISGISFPALICGEDLWVFPHIVDKCNLVSVVNETVYYYFQRSDSVMHLKPEKSKYDELESTLFIVQFLWKKGFYSSARKWYERSVSKAVLFKSKKTALRLFGKYFNSSERHKLMIGASLKLRTKWISLYVPMLFYAVNGIKRILKRG